MHQYNICRSKIFDQPKESDTIVASQDSNLMADWEVIDGVSSKKPPPPAVKVKPRNRLVTAEKLQDDGDERKKTIMPSPQVLQKGKEMVSISPILQ